MEDSLAEHQSEDSNNMQNELDPIEAEAERSLRRLLAPGIKLILVKGIPGAGKTSLATRLLEYVGSGTYISSRVGLEKLSEQNPHLKRMEHEGKFDHLSLELERVSYEDMRLGFADDVIKKVLESISRKKELIILDSWDTMAKEMEKVERLKNEKIIASVIDTSDSRCVFISEEPELTSTDYLVDAIVTLDYVEMQGRRLRQITWEKVRGQPVPYKRQLYTLQDGRFTTIGAVSLWRGEKRRFEPVPHGRNYFSTGSRDLDEFFGGGLHRGQFVLLEVGMAAGNNWHIPMYQMIAANFILNGGTCVVVPPPHITPQMVLDYESPLIGEELVKSRMRVMSYLKLESNHHHPSLVDLSGKTAEEAYDIQMRAAMDLKANNPNNATAWFLSMDTYEAFGGTNKSTNASLLAHGTAALRQYGDVNFMLAKASTSSLQPLSDNCDIHLKLEAVDRSLIMLSKRPPTAAYAVNYDYRRGYPQVLLKRII